MSEPLMSVAGQLVGIPAEKYSGTNGVTVDQNNKTIGLDETVLWENASGVNEDAGFTISEPFTNFERIRYIGNTNGCYFSVEVPVYNGITSSFRFGVTYMCADNDLAPLQICGKSFTSNNGLTYVASRSEARWFNYDNTTVVGGVQPFWGNVHKIIGISRKQQGGNA